MPLSNRNHFSELNSIPSVSKNDFKLTWKNLSIWLKKKCARSFLDLGFCNGKDEYVKILNNVSGFVYSGSLMAIIGTSGAGKTTLLTTLSQRTNGVTIGEIKLNNKTIRNNEMKKISGFLPQHELITGSLTVAEHLQFMARLKMDRTISYTERNQIIFIILSRLGLTDATHTKIKKLSGGQIKKLSLAEQLLTDPPFLFCDEPTTGLDSYNAEMVIKILQDICSFGKAVICTIHQPTYGIFEIFDHVTFLAKGTLLYHGPTDEINTYFATLGLKCPIGFNPIELYVSHFARIQDNPIDIQKLREHFQKSGFNKHLKRNLSLNNNNTNINNEEIQSKHEQVYSVFYSNKTKLIFQIYWLLWRHYMSRNTRNIYLRFALYMFIAVLLSTMYWDIATELQQRDVQNLEGLFSLVITETIFTFTYSVLHTFPEEMPKLLREINDGLFDLKAYYISAIISLFPLLIIETVCYSIIIFWSVGLSGGFLGYLYFYFPIFFCAMSSSAYGFALSTSFESVATASLMSVPIEFLGMTYSGIYLNIVDLPWITSWIPYTSQFYYGTEAVSLIQWESIDKLQCDNPELPCFNGGRSVLQKYGYQLNNFPIDLLALFGYFLICHIISYLSFRKRCKQQAVY